MNALLLHEEGVNSQSLDAIQLGMEAIGGRTPLLGATSIDVREFNGLPMLNHHQTDSSRILDDFPAWPAGNLCVVATQKDLGHEGVNFLFGLSRLGEGKLVVSTSRLEDSPTAITGLVAHELGHAFGLVNEHQSNYDLVPRFAGHCANVCIMQPINNKTEMQAGARLMYEMPQTAGFCGDCDTQLARVALR